MQLKILSKRSLLIIVFSGLTLSAILFSYFIQGKSMFSKQSSAIINSEMSMRIKVPKINVDAPIISVGLTSHGSMDVPKGPSEAAWLNLGPRPGENGSAVIAGHYGWKNDIPAVFDNLHKLRKGDKIFVEDENLAVTTFVVREIRIYGKDEAVPEAFGSDDGKAHLNLITCTGAWNTAEKSRSDRLVVFTDKE